MADRWKRTACKNEYDLKIKNKFIELLPDIKPFVFLSKPDMSSKMYEVNNLKEATNIKNASPFSIYSLEADTDFLLILEDETEPDKGMAIHNVVVNDSDPNRREIFAAMSDVKGTNLFVFLDDTKNYLFIILNDLVESFIDFMNSKTSLVNIQDETHKIQYTDQDNKVRAAKITKVVYIKDGRDKKANSKKIKGAWTPFYSWRVRGHWRKIEENSLGKNRSGEYCIKGLTWVVDCVKGKGDLIEKVRVIK